MKGFMDFIREQGVVGLAVGFILGKAVGDLVGAIVASIIDPLLGLVLGAAGSLTTMTVAVGDAELLVGHLVSVFIDFLVIALVVYYGVKGLGLDKLDKSKE